ncbi:MAG: hypothetical protein EX271_06560, partial [Acidimicrobiales bacterium]
MADEPTQVQILEQLEKIIESEVFSASPRKQRFLRYIVEKKLAGEASSLKGYAIGVDVFERDESFDPQADTIVRVHARNLRKSLDLYYLTSGKDDLVRIEVPTGSYVPRFTVIDAAASTSDGSKSETPFCELQVEESTVRNLHNIWIKPALILLVFATVLLIAFLLSRDTQDGTNVFDQAAQMPSGPSVAIVPFEFVSARNADLSEQNFASLKFGLHYELVDKLSRFRDIVVLELNNDDIDQIMDGSIQAQFILNGAIRVTGGQLRVTSVLSKTSSGEVLWSRNYNRRLDSSANIFEIQSNLAADVAASLGKPNSKIHTRFEAEKSKLSEVHIDHYYCLMRFYVYVDHKTLQEHREIRACLEEATSHAPNFSTGFAALSRIYADEELSGFNFRPDAPPPMQRALNFALRSVSLDPENAMAHHHLAIAHFWRGDFAAFKESAKIALELNPNNTDILAQFGNFLIRLGEYERGKAIVEKAHLLNPTPSSWYYSSLTVYYYMTDDPENALKYAKKYKEYNTP